MYKYLNFIDILVPTEDFVKRSYIILQLLLAGIKILCVGPTGTGKTATIVDILITKLPPAYITEIINFSARTSANQTQVNLMFYK